MRKVVVNTTPIIALAEINQLEILRELYGEIYIPDAVMNEVKSEAEKTQLINAEWIRKIKIAHPERKDLFKARLHSGEVEVMILAEEQSADLMIMDDNAAKKTAKFLGYRVTGTLGILVKAKENGIIDQVGPLLDQLIINGFYIDGKLKRLVLKSAGEL